MHQSTNEEIMEKFCMGRWLLLADYFQGLEQERRARMRKGGRTGEAEGGDERGRKRHTIYLLVLDTDVALLQSPERLINAGTLDWGAVDGRTDADEDRLPGGW